MAMRIFPNRKREKLPVVSCTVNVIAHIRAKRLCKIVFFLIGFVSLACCNYLFIHRRKCVCVYVCVNAARHPWKLVYTTTAVCIFKFNHIWWSLLFTNLA